MGYLDDGLAIWGVCLVEGKITSPHVCLGSLELPMISVNAQRSRNRHPWLDVRAVLSDRSGMAEIRNNKAHANGKFMPGCLLLDVQGVSTRGGRGARRGSGCASEVGGQTRIGRVVCRQAGVHGIVEIIGITDSMEGSLGR